MFHIPDFISAHAPVAVHDSGERKVAGCDIAVVGVVEYADLPADASIPLVADIGGVAFPDVCGVEFLGGGLYCGNANRLAVGRGVHVRIERVVRIADPPRGGFFRVAARIAVRDSRGKIDFVEHRRGAVQIGRRYVVAFFHVQSALVWIRCVFAVRSHEHLCPGGCMS